MTREEFNDLFEDMTYGHDAELLIGGKRVFAEWAENGLTLWHILGDDGTLINEVSGNNMTDTVRKFFETPVFGKILNVNYGEIEILDIE